MERESIEKCWELSHGWHQLPHHLSKQGVWAAMRAEAVEYVVRSMVGR